MSQPQSAQEVLNAQGNAIVELQKTVAELVKKVQSLTSFDNLVNSLASQKSAENGKADKSRPKPCLPETEKFNGTSSHWETWFPMISAKLELDGEAIGTEKAQFFYLYSRLEEKVQQLVQPQLIQADFKPSAILDQLARHFDNPHKVQDAEEKIQTIKQYKDEHFMAFLARFERLFYRCSANKWPEHIQISLMRRAISSDLKEKLRLVDKPSSYTDLVSKLQRLAGSVSSGHSEDKTNSKTTSNGGDKMDISAINASINSLDLSCLPEDVESGHSDEDDVEEFMTEQQNYAAKHT